MIITGWKAIATTLNVSVRTAHTLRVRHGLPVVNLTPRLVALPADRLAAWLCRTLPNEALDSGMPDAAGSGL